MEHPLYWGCFFIVFLCVAGIPDPVLCGNSWYVAWRFLWVLSTGFGTYVASIDTWCNPLIHNVFLVDMDPWWLFVYAETTAQHDVRHNTSLDLVCAPVPILHDTHHAWHDHSSKTMVTRCAPLLSLFCSMPMPHTTKRGHWCVEWQWSLVQQ